MVGEFTHLTRCGTLELLGVPQIKPLAALKEGVGDENAWLFRELEPQRVGIFKYSITDAIREVPGRHDDEIVGYLDSGIPLIDIMETAADVLGGDARISGGSSILTDGTWVWRQDLSFYVQNYHLELDGDFVEHAMKMNFAIPEPDHSSLLALADNVLREVLDMS